MKSRKIALWALFILLSSGVSAQIQEPHFNEYLKAASDSPMMRMLNQQKEASQLEASRSTLLDDPEVEFGYYWGNPAEIGKRWDLSVSQNLSLPQVYVHLKNMKQLLMENADLEYRVRRASLLHEIQHVCAEIVHAAQQLQVRQEVLKSEQSMMELYQKRFQAGDCNVIEYNRMQNSFARCQVEYTNSEIELTALKERLKVLMGETNGFSAPLTDYPAQQLPADFSSWWKEVENQSPELQLLQQEINISQGNIQAAKDAWMPNFSVGYASENVIGETFRGVTVGASIPLWKNRKAVNVARMNQEVARLNYEQANAALKAEVQMLISRANALQLSERKLDQQISSCNSLPQLEKAIELGHISLEEYLQNVSAFREMQFSLLDTRLELEMVLLELYAPLL